MTFSALDSTLTGPLFATDAMRAIFSDRARLAAMLKAETALALAEAEVGLVPKALATALARLEPDEFDPAALGARTADAGVVAIPFVKAVEAKLPEALRGRFHFGATSQDIVDTAAALLMRDAIGLIEGELKAVTAGLRALAKRHRETPMVGRTYCQHAAPITFGYVAATWLSGVAEVGAMGTALRDPALTASLGGPVGTLAALGDKAQAVVSAYAAELGLAEPAPGGHTNRAATAAIGSWLAILIGALAKMATDVVFLSSTEVGEVAEAHGEGRGGSSSMPHKRNPVSATVILAAHGVAPGLAAALVSSMAAAGQRPAGAWHAEWHALPQLFGFASGALREARRIAEGLTVDEARMRDNLGLTRGLLFSDAVANVLAPKLGRMTAQGLVAASVEQVADGGTTLGETLAGNSAIPRSLRNAVDEAFDLTPAIDAAAAMTDQVLAAFPDNKKKR
jgi:3-carboxy-cis,cis-muconate cycloisomerase